MGALSDMWKQVEALAEKSGETLPRWVLWDAAAREAGFAIYAAPSRDAAMEMWRKEIGEATRLCCAIASEEQIETWDRAMASIPRPTVADLKRLGVM